MNEIDLRQAWDSAEYSDPKALPIATLFLDQVFRAVPADLSAPPEIWVDHADRQTCLYQETRPEECLAQALVAGTDATSRVPADQHALKAKALGIPAHEHKYQRDRITADLGKSTDASEERAAAVAPEYCQPRSIVMFLEFSADPVSRFSRPKRADDLQAAMGAITASVMGAKGRGLALGAFGGPPRYSYENNGICVYLQNPIKLLSKALMLMQPNNPHRPSPLGSVRDMPQISRDRTQSSLGLGEGVLFSREALMSPGIATADLRGIVNNPPMQFNSEYQVLGLIEDLDDSLFLGRWKLETTLTKDPQRASNCQSPSAVEGIERAIQLAREALSEKLRNHQRRAEFLINLCNTLDKKARLHASEAAICNRLVASQGGVKSGTAAPLQRIRPLRLAADILISRSIYLEASYFLEEAVQLLQQSLVGPYCVGDIDEQKILTGTSGLPSDAACVAILAGKGPVHALRLLERGRGLILGSIIDGRSDASMLKGMDPELYDEFEQLRARLNVPLAGSNTKVSASSQGGNCWATEKRKSDLAQLNRVLAQVRKLPGLDDFQLPPKAEGLMEMAKGGAIVTVLNSITLDRSYAIIVTETDITTLPLPEMSYQDIGSNLAVINASLTGTLRTCHARGEKLGRALCWLWDVAVDPILQSLKAKTTDGTSLPRIWWVGVGLLSQLPFHAAGYHQHSDGSAISGRSTIDLAISSYASSIKALAYTREKPPAFFLRPKATRLLVVTMQDTPTRKPLEGVNDEAKELIRLLATPTATHLDRPNARLALEAIRKCDIVHFACHGESVASNPTESHLLLADTDNHGNERIDRLTVRAVAGSVTEGGGIAFLRACYTAHNPSLELQDEAIHLACAFQLAGFGHVLGTMWNTRNYSCAAVSKMFYEYLLEEASAVTTAGEVSEGGHKKVATAFHRAVKAWREDCRGNPLLWASFVHFGG